jgi:hypothetical protein
MGVKECIQNTVGKLLFKCPPARLGRRQEDLIIRQVLERWIVRMEG